MTHRRSSVSRRRGWRWKLGLALALAAATFALAMAVVQSRSESEADVAARTGAAEGRIKFGILGDSDSHSYQDSVSFPPGTRFGAYRSVTFVWPEVLARLRSDRLDFGPWGIRGTRRSVAEVMDWFGLRGRVRRENYLYNFAFIGASCDSLTGYNGRMTRRLLAEMDRQPAAWRQGIVYIGLGTNDFGHQDSLDALARDPADPAVQGKIANCLRKIGEAIRSIRAQHPTTRFVLAATLADVNDPSLLDRWRSAEAIRNIDAGLDVYIKGLQAIADADSNVVAADPRPWFAGLWGGRDHDGNPNFRPVVIDGTFSVAHAAGDDPKNAMTADEHGGVVWSTLWARHLVRLINAKFGTGIRPITDQEVAEFLRPAIAASR